MHVGRKPSLGYLFVEYGVHHHLEGRWGVGKPKEHDRRFEESLGSEEWHFGFIAWLDAYVVVSPSDIELREEGAPAQMVNCLGNKGGDVAIPFGPLVYWIVVLDGSEFPVFLLDKEEVRSIGAP